MRCLLLCICCVYCDISDTILDVTRCRSTLFGFDTCDGKLAHWVVIQWRQERMAAVQSGHDVAMDGSSRGLGLRCHQEETRADRWLNERRLRDVGKFNGDAGYVIRMVFFQALEVAGSPSQTSPRSTGRSSTWTDHWPSQQCSPIVRFSHSASHRSLFTNL